MPHLLTQSVSQSALQTESSAVLLVPRALLLDTRLTPTERNAWMVFRSQVDHRGMATVSHESLRTALQRAPGAQKAASATVSHVVLSLRLSGWVELIGHRHHPLTGLPLGGRYLVHDEPLSFVDACLSSEDYLSLLEHGLRHTQVTVRQLARHVLDEAVNFPDELARLPSDSQEQVKRLYRQAHSNEDGSDDGSSPGSGFEKVGQTGQHLSPDQTPSRQYSTPSTFLKYASKNCDNSTFFFFRPTPETPETERTYLKNKVYKEVPTYRAPCNISPVERPSNERSGVDPLAHFKQLLDADQQTRLSDRLQTLPVEQRRDVLAEWSVRCAAGKVRDAAAYLFGLIKKALEGTFHLWAARKSTVKPPAPERPVSIQTASNVQEVPKETSKPSMASGTASTEPADQPASRKVASAYLQQMKALLQNMASTTPVIRVTKPPDEHKHPQTPLVRTLAQAMPPAGQPRPLAAFLTPILETTGR
jgi:hypothetical protein